jgi:FkbM family methyltransferase
MTDLIQPQKYQNLIYDVGMHQGEDTDFYLKKGFRVIAFEAEPDLVAICQKRFEVEIKAGLLTIVEGAIVDFLAEKKPPTSIRFFKNKDNDVWGTVIDEWAVRNERSGTNNEVIDVPTVNFSTCLQQYGIPHYLKVDIEGMDIVCLKALLPFDEKPDYISIESDKLSFQKLEHELDLFTQLGFTAFKAINQAKIACQKEPLVSCEGYRVGYEFLDGSSGLFGSDLPGLWMSHALILKRYRSIFRVYEWFGDFGKIKKCYIGRVFLKALKKFSNKPIPGWYDTHAKRI